MGEPTASPDSHSLAAVAGGRPKVAFAGHSRVALEPLAALETESVDPALVEDGGDYLPRLGDCALVVWGGTRNEAEVVQLESLFVTGK